LFRPEIGYNSGPGINLKFKVMRHQSHTGAI
jgi:hypothetical protein